MDCCERPEFGHIHAWVLGNETAQEFRRGGRERFEDRLIRITHPHPVPVWTGKQAENILLQATQIPALHLRG